MASADQLPLDFKLDEPFPDQPPAPADPVRSDLWYDDGNIVLQAENTQFKVYRGILIENSTVFRDMFSLPQLPSDVTDMIEGCSLVRLYDSAEEVGYILQALFRHRCIMALLRACLPSELFTGIWHLAAACHSLF